MIWDFIMKEAKRLSAWLGLEEGKGCFSVQAIYKKEKKDEILEYDRQQIKEMLLFLLNLIDRLGNYQKDKN